MHIKDWSVRNINKRQHNVCMAVWHYPCPPVRKPCQLSQTLNFITVRTMYRVKHTCQNTLSVYHYLSCNCWQKPNEVYPTHHLGVDSRWWHVNEVTFQFVHMPAHTLECTYASTNLNINACWIEQQSYNIPHDLAEMFAWINWQARMYASADNYEEQHGISSLSCT